MWSTPGLNSEFSFSYTGYFTKAKEPSLPYYQSTHVIDLLTLSTAQRALEMWSCFIDLLLSFFIFVFFSMGEFLQSVGTNSPPNSSSYTSRLWISIGQVDCFFCAGKYLQHRM